MFKFNFNSNSEEDEKKEIDSSDKNQSEVIKESTRIEKTHEQYEEIAKSLLNSSLNMFTSNEIEIGYLDCTLMTDNSKTDLISGVYEGGYKIWECTQDLADYFTANENDFSGKKVCDLGCSSGLLGIFMLSKGAQHVDFQDYNEDVLEKFTIPNAILWCEESENSKDFSKCAFYSGDWDSFRDLTTMNDKYDIIITSETIYNSKYYEKLLNLFKSRLKSDGRIYLAAKSHYFGVGGNVLDFCKLLNDDGIFNSEVVWKSTTGLQREILLLTRKENKE